MKSSDGDPRRFAVSPGGETTQLDAAAADHEPDAESRRRAKLIAQGGGFGSRDEDFLARGIAVARSGGDVRAWLGEKLQRPRP